MCRLPLCTPNVMPTISGVIVERRDQVRITCGRCEPARMRSTTFRMPLSTQAPFFTERGISFPFRISKFEFRNYLTLRSLTIIFLLRLFRLVLYTRVGCPHGVTGFTSPEG